MTLSLESTSLVSLFHTHLVFNSRFTFSFLHFSFLFTFHSTLTTYLIHKSFSTYRLLIDAEPGADLRWGRGARAPRFTCCPQIQKLADRSDVISEVPKCSKILIFRSSAPDPSGGSLQRSPSWGLGSLLPSQEPHPRSRPFGPRFYTSQGLTHYRVGNPTNDRSQSER